MDTGINPHISLDNQKKLLIIIMKNFQIWKIFSNEIEHCYINIIHQSKKKINSNVNLLCISQYLKNQYSIIINALDWIGNCNIEKLVRRYKLFRFI